MVIIGPNATVVLERFIRNGNLSCGNRFKFIERTPGIEAHRGIKADDGLIRAEFWAEKEVVDQPIIRHHYYDHWYPVPRPYYPLLGGTAKMAPDFDNSLEFKEADVNDAGITVPGSESNQQFYHASGFQLESNSSVVVLQLRGVVGGVQVAAPLTVEHKPTCSTCGKVNRATNRFCDQCGTALQIL
jgi:hypothetical protein